MYSEEYKLVTLKDREDLLQKSVELLNKEWPRSQTAREHSQRRSVRPTPPMAFLFIHLPTDELIGHARVCLLPNRSESIWIESVIITNTHRGKGLGKFLMNLVEDFCRHIGFKQAFLSTEDQVEFYKRCGYVECAPILHSTAATSVFPVFDKIELDLPPVVKCPAQNNSCLLADGAPPPPPPPPLKEQKSNRISTIDHQYMVKNL